MKFNSRGRLLVGVVFLALLLPARASAEAKYPAELEFLSRIKPPTYYYATGIIEEADTTNRTVAQLPFRFYWEKGSYVLDVRSKGGMPFLFSKGVADTIWVYDFQRGIKLVMLKDQHFEWLSQLPFRLNDLLSLFNIFPNGFTEIDTFYQEGSYMTVILKDGARYKFNTAPAELVSISREESVISCSNFLLHGGMAWSKRVEINKGLFSGPGGRLQMNTTKLSFDRQPDRKLLSVPLPPEMPRVFDLRSQVVPGD